MSVYSYKVRDQSGDLIESTMEAENEGVVLSKLRDEKYFIIKVKKSIGSQKINLKIDLFNKITIKDISIFTRQFSTLISSGMALIESLNVLSKQTSNKRLANIILDVRRNIETGLSLSESLAKHKKIFPKMYTSLVNAGETGGVLDETLDRLATFLEKENTMKTKINNKTAYPKFVLGFAVVIIIALILFIIPTFQEIYDELGTELPSITKFVIFIGSLFKKWYFYVAIVLIIFGGRYCIRKIGNTKKGRRMIDNMRIKFPKIGDIIRKIALSRFSSTLGTLIKSGVPILRSLEIVKGITNNSIIDDAVDDISKNVMEGESVATPMLKYNIFTPMMIQMIAVGERSGTLDSMLSKISDFYDEEVSNSVDIIATVLEPIMLLFVALIVGVILLSMYLPLFNIYQSIT